MSKKIETRILVVDVTGLKKGCARMVKAKSGCTSVALTDKNTKRTTRPQKVSLKDGDNAFIITRESNGVVKVYPAELA